MAKQNKSTTTEKEATEWFMGKARTAAGYRKNIVRNEQRARDSTVIGKMYFFAYDPKTKDKLPIYDKFPLVLPIEGYSDGFLGLNLHYLSGGERTLLLGRLLEYRNNTRYDKTTRIRMSYDILASTKNLASLARPCIKRYLFSHCRSRFIEIIPDEWEKAVALPVQFFVVKK